MSILGRLIPDAPGRYRVCGRECTDGSPCGNIVDTPGEACWIDSHRPEDPRVDGGPTSPDEVPLSGAGVSVMKGGMVLGKALAAAFVAYLGLGRFVGNTLIHAAGVTLALSLALVLDVYRRRAMSEGDSTD